jgi:hypothetical protein
MQSDAQQARLSSLTCHPVKVEIGAGRAMLAEHRVPGAGRGKRLRLREAAGVKKRVAAAS